MIEILASTSSLHRCLVKLTLEFPEIGGKVHRHKEQENILTFPSPEKVTLEFHYLQEKRLIELNPVFDGVQLLLNSFIDHRIQLQIV